MGIQGGMLSLRKLIVTLAAMRSPGTLIN